jgi:predicted dehydrogenase
MAAAAQKYGKHLNIGFQLCYMDSILALKQDVLKGELGKPLCMSALICWPRTGEYYARSWCAKRKWNGMLVLDSIAMNACAHYLNLMYFLGGKTMDSAAEPVSAEAILAKANDIETYDTAIIRTFTKDYETRLLSTHVCGRRINPVMKFSFEKADVYIKEAVSEDAVEAVFHDGRVRLYGRTNNYSKLPYCFDIVRGLKMPTCTPATARAHLKLVNAVTEKIPVLTVSDKTVIDDVVVVPGMDDLLERAYQENKLPWELTDVFGSPTKIDLTNYDGWYEDL